MTDEEISTAFQCLWNDVNLGENFPSKRPLLAHYTSIGSLESIMCNDEVWFSNPLYMNDLEELRFGITEGVLAFRQSEEVQRACGGTESYSVLSGAFERYYENFSNNHALDTYVFCLSEHDRGNPDGLLSMWRGYGGNGQGAAIIFDTEKIDFRPEGSPLIISKVVYASSDERRNWIKAKLTDFAGLVAKCEIPRDKLYLPAYLLFERLKTFALFTKHRGFSEEREWRIVYLRERDRANRLESMLHYSVGRNGIEPRLKLKVKPIEGLTRPDQSLERLVSQVILGPTISSPLAVASVRRMLEKVGKAGIAERVVGSTTPFRQ